MILTDLLVRKTFVGVLFHQIASLDRCSDWLLSGLTVGTIYCLFPLSASATEPADPQTASYTIFYTGRLFGYFRYPELQKTSDHGCPSLESNGPLPQTAAPEALAFQEELKTMHANTTGTELRVAVGDNFAPYLLGRDIWDNTTPSSQTPSKTAEDLDAKAAYEYDTDQKKLGTFK